MLILRQLGKSLDLVGAKAKVQAVSCAQATAIFFVIASISLSTVSSAQDFETLSIEDAQSSELVQYESRYSSSWGGANPDEEYVDTVFGEFLYNEASLQTKVEMLELLSKDTPSMLVFLTGLSMGLDLEQLLQASVRYEPDKGRDLAASAITVMPLLEGDTRTLYTSYDLEDMDRDSEDDPYSIAEVVERFFENRRVLRPYPDWYAGQYHFMASARELKELQDEQEQTRWYHSKSSVDAERRPIFVSLYEYDKTVVIDGHERIEKALSADEDARLPVVFIFNQLSERPIDKVDYEMTLRGVQRAYAEQGIMVTPTPEWKIGDHHIQAEVEEFYKVFDVPSEEDFEPEYWALLLAEAEKYRVNDTSLLVVILGSEDGDNETAGRMIEGLSYASLDGPRASSRFPYVAPGGRKPTFRNIIGNGVVFARTDLIAALNALGVNKVPVSFYYLDSTRTKPYSKGPRGLVQSIIGLEYPNNPLGGSGGLTCASPPCTE